MKRAVEGTDGDLAAHEARHQFSPARTAVRQRGKNAVGEGHGTLVSRGRSRHGRAHVFLDDGYRRGEPIALEIESGQLLPKRVTTLIDDGKPIAHRREQ